MLDASRVIFSVLESKKEWYCSSPMKELGSLRGKMVDRKFVEVGTHRNFTEDRLDTISSASCDYSMTMPILIYLTITTMEFLWPILFG